MVRNDRIDRVERRHDRVPARVGALAMAAGALGALAKALYLMTVSAMQGHGFFTVPNLSGAFYTSATPVPLDFAGGTTLMGVLMHLVTGAFWGLIFGAIVAYLLPQAIRTNGRAALSGLVFGLVVYLVSMAIGPSFNYLTSLTNPLLGALHPLVGTLIFGVVTALAFRAFTRRREYSVMFAPETATVADRDRVHY